MYENNVKTGVAAATTCAWRVAAAIWLAAENFKRKTEKAKEKTI